MPPLVVEGITDAVFFGELLRLHLSNVTVTSADQFRRRGIPASVTGHFPDGSVMELEFRNQDPNTEGGINKIPDAVAGLIRIGQPQFLVAQDLNSGSPSQIANSVAGMIRTSGVPIHTQDNLQVRGEGVVIGIMPMGLTDDVDMNALGVTSHSIEDYLIKVILLDESLRPGVTRLLELLTRLLATARGQPYELPFNSSKQVFQLVKSVIGRYNDTGIVRWLFQRADRGLLSEVTQPVLDRLIEAIRP